MTVDRSLAAPASTGTGPPASTMTTTPTTAAAIETGELKEQADESVLGPSLALIGVAILGTAVVWRRRR